MIDHHCEKGNRLNRFPRLAPKYPLMNRRAVHEECRHSVERRRSEKEGKRRRELWVKSRAAAAAFFLMAEIVFKPLEFQ
jgi:hypothetical protein